MTSTPETLNLSPYGDGDVIPQQWNPVFIFFALVTSFTASYSAVRLLDHDLWRTEKEKDHASAIIIKHAQAVAAILLGFGTVWSMHFVGMAAVTLEKAPICYDWPITLGSLVSAVVFFWAGVLIASRDVFQCNDRLEKLKRIVISKKNVTAKGRQKQAQRTIHLVAFCYRPWFILSGATVAATGALIMHYTGMLAIEGPFRKVWSIPYVSASVLLGIVICAVGFWILFRLLLWKVEQFWLRPASAAVIAGAVCTLHFFGMLSVTYIFDESSVGTCEGRPGYSDPQSQRWTVHQILALAVGIAVPSLALLVENLICRELFHAYAKLKDPALTVEFILEAGSRSRDSNVRRASLMTKKALANKGAHHVASNAAQSFGVTNAAALVAAEDAADSLEPEITPDSLESAPPSRRASGMQGVNVNGPCSCTCPGCHANNPNRRVSFLDEATGLVASSDAANRRGSAFSSTSGGMVVAAAAVEEGSELEHREEISDAVGQITVESGASYATTSESSLDDLAVQIRREAESVAVGLPRDVMSAGARNLRDEDSFEEVAARIRQSSEKNDPIVLQ